MTSRRLAIATCDHNELAGAADAPLVRAFTGFGVRAERVAWNDTRADWSSYDGVLVRSTWDWHHHPERFVRGLESVGRLTRVWNPASAIAWSLDKRCLVELASHGVRTVPGVIIESVDAIRDFESPWADWVVKPVLGATAYRTSRIRSRDEMEAWRRDNAAFTGVLIAQQFQPTVLERGEVSLVYLAGSFSHAVRKIAKKGDFRVQAEFGGTAEVYTPTARDLDLAARCLRHVATPLAFARIDLLHDAAGDPMVIECELAEPELFFGHAPGSAERLAEHVASLLAQR